MHDYNQSKQANCWCKIGQIQKVHKLRHFINPRILKCGQNLFLESPIPDVFTFSRVNAALSVTWSNLENQGHPPWTNFMLVNVT